MNEYVGNLHIHTTASDGYGNYDEVAQAALRAGLEFIVVTDHNQYAGGLDGYRYQGDRRVLLLVGQEVHDLERRPERSHLLVFGVEEDLSAFAPNPQALISEAAARGGLSFLAHPVECSAPKFNQGDHSWADWDVRDFTGIELWNFMSEFKCLLTSWPHAIYYSYFPSRIAHGPPVKLIERWDAQLTAGLQVVAIGNSDAHAIPARAGPLRRVLFPYQWLFTAVNTHVLMEPELSGDAVADRTHLLSALRHGHCFVGYDRRVSTRGFSFTGHSEIGDVIMGDRLSFELGATLQVRCPTEAQVSIHHEGSVVQSWPRTRYAVLTVNRPGAYRVEARLEPDRAWIFSNPIYLQRRQA